MTTTRPRKGPPKGHQSAHPRSHQCAHHPHVPQRTTKAPDLQDVRVMAKCDPDAMLWQEQALKTQVTHPSLTTILPGTGHQYRTTWVKGVPISNRSEVQSHVHHNLGVEGRLATYELVGPTWQLNVVNVHVPFGDAHLGSHTGNLP